MQETGRRICELRLYKLGLLRLGLFQPESLKPRSVAPRLPNPRWLRHFALRLGMHLVLTAGCCAVDSATHKVLIRDIANVEGVRDNSLVGYGLVVGLRGTGDK